MKWRFLTHRNRQWFHWPWQKSNMSRTHGAGGGSEAKARDSTCLRTLDKSTTYQDTTTVANPSPVSHARSQIYQTTHIYIYMQTCNYNIYIYMYVYDYVWYKYIYICICIYICIHSVTNPCTMWYSAFVCPGIKRSGLQCLCRWLFRIGIHHRVGRLPRAPNTPLLSLLSWLPIGSMVLVY